MTVDELVGLTEALLSATGLDLKQLRDLGAPAVADDLTDEEFLLAVRFLAGERPTGGAPEQPRPRRQLVPLNEDELAERLAKFEELDEDTPAGPIDIGDGVTLGI